MLMKFSRVQTEDRTVNQLQDNLGNALNPLFNNPQVDGILLTEVTLLSGVTNRINHKLGRKLKGWIVTRIRASATVYDDQDNNTTPTLTLNLIPSADVTVDLYVF